MILTTVLTEICLQQVILVSNIHFLRMKPTDYIPQFKFLVEQNAYGVCERVGEKLQIPAKDIRLFFVYASCLTIGSPVIIYMILAFWMKMRHIIRTQRTAVWDL